MGGTPNRYFRIPDPVGPVAATAARCGVSHADAAIYGAMLWVASVVRWGLDPAIATTQAMDHFHCEPAQQHVLQALGEELRRTLGPAGPP